MNARRLLGQKSGGARRIRERRTGPGDLGRTRALKLRQTLPVLPAELIDAVYRRLSIFP